MTDFVEKLITNKCYIIIDSKVTQSWGGKVYNYHWYGYLSTKKQLKNLEREQEKEGWIQINSVDAIKKDDDSWLCIIHGTANGGKYFDYEHILDSITKVVLKK